MTDRPDDAEPHRRPDPAAPGTALPSREVSAADPGGVEMPPAPPIESSLLGTGGDRSAMPRRPEIENPERPVTIDAADPEAGQDSVEGAEAASPSRADEMETARSAIPPVTRLETPAPAAAAPPAGTGRRTEPAAPRRRGGFMPLFLGGVAAAALGAGTAWWAVPRLPTAWQPAVPAVNNAAPSGAAAEAVRAEMERQAAAVETRAIEAARQAASDAATQAAGASLAGQSESLISQARQAGADAAAQLLAQAPATPGADPSVETALAAQARQLAALDEAVTGLRNAPAQSVDLSPLQSALDDQAARIAALEQGAAQPAADPAVESALQAQSDRIAALEQDLAALRDAPPVDLAPLQAQLDAQADRIDELAQRPVVDAAAVEQLNALATEADAASQRIADAATQAQARLSEAEARAAALADAADEAARRAHAASATVALGEALQTGASPSAALAQLEDAGVAPPPALTAKVPTLDELAAAFTAAARAGVRAALQAEAAQGRGSILGNFLRAQTGARSVEPREGADADAVLSRAGAAVERGQIRAALDELAALPEPARPAMADWTAQAQAYVDAQAALGRLVAPAPGAAGDAAASTPDAAEPVTPAPSAGTAAAPENASDAAPAAAPPAAEPTAAPSAPAPAAEADAPPAPASTEAPATAAAPDALRPTPPVITTTVPLLQPDTPPADAAAAPSN